MKSPFLNQFERQLFYCKTLTGSVKMFEYRWEVFIREVRKRLFNDKWQPMDYYLASRYPYHIAEIRWFIKNCRKIKRSEPTRKECKEIIEYATSHAITLTDSAIIYFNTIH